MEDPQTTSPGSIMPGYPWLYTDGLDYSSIAAKIEEADDGDNDDLEDNIGIGLSSEIYENANLTINWESSEDFSGNETDTVAVELSVSF